jgi:hypothetical protein
MKEAYEQLQILNKFRRRNWASNNGETAHSIFRIRGNGDIVGGNKKLRIVGSKSRRC